LQEFGIRSTGKETPATAGRGN